MAQLDTGLTPPSASSGTSEAAPTGGTPGGTPTGGTPAGTPVGAVPSILPPPPSGPFGLPNPLTPPNALPSGAAAAAVAQPVSPFGLPPPGAGITTLQLYDPNAPALLIQPYVSGGVRGTDNVNYTATNRQAAAEFILGPGVSISADTPRFQGVLSGTASGNLYVPTSNLNRIYANLYGNGTGTIVPDHFFVDLKSSLSEASTLPGLGFISPTLLPNNVQTQTFTNSLSPYLRESYDGLVDTELRYTFASTNFGNNTTVISTTNPVPTNLSGGILNEGTFTAATGTNFERALSRLTIDASDFNSSSTSRNEQVSAFNDFGYRFKPNIAAIGRIGYQNLRYPFAPEATFAGATWLAGASIGSAANYGYASLEYGRVQGVYGFTGSANYQITPTITVHANLAQGISSPTQYFQSSLINSTLSPNGSIVDQYSGLPTAFYTPGIGLTNNVYRQRLYNFGVTDQIGINSYALYSYLSYQQSLIPPVPPPTNSIGAFFNYSRDIRPDLNGNASIGYSRSVNVVTINSPTPINNTSTVTANIGVNYLLSRALTGSILYSFSYSPNGGLIVNGRSGDIIANSLQVLLTKGF